MKRLFCVTAALAVAFPGMGVAAPLTQAQWSLIYRDIGSDIFLPAGIAHYSTDWEVASLTLEYRPLQVRRRNDAHWNVLLDGSRQRLFSTIGASGWLRLSKRFRAHGGFRHEPVLNLAISTLGLSAQVLPGTAKRSAFLVGLATTYMQNPQFKFVGPHLFLDWSNELGRTTGSPRPPWIFYVGARIDQGIRWVFNDDPAIATERAANMETYIRGGFRIRHRRTRVGFDFGGQQQRSFTYSWTVGYLFSRPQQDR